MDLGPEISSNKHIYEVRIYDANYTEIGMVKEAGESTDADQVKALSGKILISSAGTYTIELQNNRNFCKGSVKNVILSYAGAAPITDFSTPYTCAADDATFVGETGNSFKLYTESEPHYIMWSDRALAEPSSTTWQIQATRACNISVSLDLGPAISSNKHIYEVRIYDANNTEVGMVGESAESTDADQIKVLAGSIQIPAVGNYTIELKNNRNFCKGSVKNVILTYAGAAPYTDFSTPYSCTADDATFVGETGNSFKLYTESEPHYIMWSDRALAEPSSTTWQIQATRACNISVSLDLGPAISSNKHIYEVRIYDANNTEVGMVGESAESTDADQIKVLAGSIQIPAVGNYTIELKNNRNFCKGSVKNVILSYAGGVVVDIPNAAIPFEDAILNGATRDGEGIHFGMADRYAQWNVAATAGLYTFTFNVSNPSTTDYGKYQLTIIDSESNTIYDEFKGLTSSGSVTHSSIYLDGNYTLKVANTNNHSQGYLTSIAATAEENVFIMDENSTDDGSIAAAAGNTYKFLLKRSFTAGRYYTICLPVGSWDSELKLAFGADYELWKMSSATQSGDEISLNFENITGQGFSAGKPYLIKPSIDVENPIFYNAKTITNSTYNNTQSFDAADFVGSFYKTEIPAGESNLYLQNNSLYYSPTNATPMKGTRAWIRLKQQSGQQAPARARIVLQDKVATGIDLVQPVDNKAVKTIENGQLVIMKNGIRYNAMGTMIK